MPMIGRFACLFPLIVAGIAPAAIIYEPVEYQYQFQYRAGPGPRFYYGGSNPLVFQRMARIGCQEQGALGTHEGCGAYGMLHRNQWNTPDFVFTDCIPWTNAALYGFSPSNARDEAYANAPRFFRKADLLAAAVTESDGSLVVPAQAQPVPQIVIKTYDPATHPAPRPILIIPKAILTPKMPANAVAVGK